MQRGLAPARDPGHHFTAVEASARPSVDPVDLAVQSGAAALAVLLEAKVERGEVARGIADAVDDEPSPITGATEAGLASSLRRRSTLWTARTFITVPGKSYIQFSCRPPDTIPRKPFM